MDADDRTERRDTEKPEDEVFLDEELIPILLIAGVLLFLFPEPATSALGIVFVVIGVVLWLRDVIA